MSKKHILFLGLSAFSQIGGIEKVNKSWLKSLNNIVEEKQTSLKAYILLDDEADEKYISQNQFKGFKGNRLHFILSGCLALFKADFIIVSHINLFPLILIAKIVNPKNKVILHAHGIEIWKPFGFLKTIALKKVDCILAVSEFTKAQLIKTHAISIDKIKVLPNSLDPYFATPLKFDKPTYLLGKYNIHANTKVLFTLARLVSTERYKGYDKILDHIPQLLKAYPELIYIIGGKADSKEEKRILDKIHTLKIHNHVIVLGYIEEEELASHYLLADVFAMPSEGEGFGIAFIEAAACGVPVLGGNIDGSKQAIIENKTGLLCNPQSREDILDHLLLLLQKPKESFLIQNEILSNFGFNAYRLKIENLIFNDESY